MPDRSEAWELLCEYTKGDSLRKHALAVEAAMRACAKRYNAGPVDEDEWGIVGLLHDFDYEMFPTADQLCGFLVACALVRPTRSLDDMEVSSVKKKLKDKAFARSVNRDDIKQGVEELGVDLDEHIRFVIDALRPVQKEIGLNPINA